MDPMSASFDSGRQRLRPGVPAGGIAAVAVTLTIIGWGLIAGEPERDLSVVMMRAPGAPLAPLPPLPPAAPAAPLIVAPPLPPAVPGADSGPVDMQSITKAVRAAVELTGKAAVAPSEALNGHNGDLRYIDRVKDGGENVRVVAEVVAPAGVRLARINGDVRIKVDPAARTVLFSMENSRNRYDLDTSDGLLWISGPGPDSEPRTRFEMTVPPNTPLLLNEHVGDLTVEGDLGAPVRLELRRGNVSIDGVASARVRVTEVGDVRIGTATGPVAVQMKGTGNVRLDRVDQLFVDLPGAGDVQVGSVANGATLSLPGAGDVRIGTLSGAFSAALPGAGEVRVNGGSADSFTVAVTGPGGVDFRGTAADPRVLLTGPGHVKVERHTGTPEVRKVGDGALSLDR